MKRKNKTTLAPEKLLEKVPADELRKFVQKQAKCNGDFACELNDWLCERFAKFPSLEEKLANRVERLFDHVEEKRGWYGHYDDYGINWTVVTEGMRDVLDALEKELEKGNARLVVRIIMKFIHTLQERNDETMCDDDYVELADLHEEFAEMLEACAKLESWPLKEKRELLEELRQASNYSVYKEYDFYSMDSLYVDVMLTALPLEEAYTELMKQESSMGERLLSHKVKLLRRLGREEEAQRTIRTNLKCDEIVFPEIERLRDAGKLPEARDLVEKRMSVRGKSVQSLKILLDIVKRQGDTPAVIETLYQLVLSVRYDLSYYRKLKKVVPPADWAKMYDRILRQLNKENEKGHLASIYAEEKDGDRLYCLIMQNHYNRFPLIMEYLPILPEKYHPELLQYGIRHLRKWLSTAAPRKEYVRFARTLKEFSRLPGGAPYVTELLAHIRTTYTRRPALIEELRDLH